MPFLNFSRIICTNFRQGHASGFWGAGLCGWNCRHTFFAVFPELGDPPAWTRDQLEEQNARNIEYNGKRYTRYEINQMQRARERNVRRWKKRYLAETVAGVDTTALTKATVYEKIVDARTHGVIDVYVVKPVSASTLLAQIRSSRKE